MTPESWSTRIGTSARGSTSGSAGSIGSCAAAMTRPSCTTGLCPTPLGGATDDYLDVLTDEETDTLSGLLDKLIDALKDRLGVDPDDEPARWMDDARRRMGEERFEVMMRMRQEGFGLGPFGDRGGHSRRERGRGGGSRRRGPDSDSFGECASGDGERGFRSRRSPMAMAREGRFAGRRLRGGRGWNE